MQTGEAAFSTSAAGSGEHIDISFQNNGDSLLSLGFINGFLKIITLGIYSFWGKTEVRKRLWSFIRFNGEPLEYTGTGKELFLGFLVVFAAVLIPIMLAGVAVALIFPGDPIAIGIYQGVLYLALFLLIGNAIYRATRYRLTRTRWRGIRGNLVGSPQSYGWTYFWTLAFPGLVVAGFASLGAFLVGTQAASVLAIIGMAAWFWVFPWRANKLQKMMTSDMRFGDRPFLYTGTAGPLYKRYAGAWFGSLVIIVGSFVLLFGYIQSQGLLPSGEPDSVPVTPSGTQLVMIYLIAIVAFLLFAVVNAWYQAGKINHFARNTHYEGATFRAETTGKGLMWLVVSNWLINMLALSIALAIGLGLAYALDLFPDLTGVAIAPASTDPALDPALPATPSIGIPFMLAIAVPVSVLSTAALTFAQFRSTRYVMSRMKLDGQVPVTAIAQGADAGLTRGEGLAQAFDVDAF